MRHDWLSPELDFLVGPCSADDAGWQSPQMSNSKSGSQYDLMFTAVGPFVRSQCEHEPDQN